MAKRAAKQTKKKSSKVPVKNNNKGGRPTKYKPDYQQQVFVLTEKGFTDKDIAEAFDVDERTVDNWKKKYPGFFQSLKKGKKIADKRVVQALYHRALGYSHPDTHISNYQGDITKTAIIKHYPPEVTACIFWLKNRDPEKWRDVQEFAGVLNITITEKFKGKDGSKD